MRAGDRNLLLHLGGCQYEEYLATQEELLLTIMDAKEEAGAVVALPTQTTFVTQDRWIDPEKAKAAKAAIEKNRNPGVPGPSKMPVGSQGERRVIERECFTPRFSWNQTLSRTTHALVKTDPAHPT
jgi:hypothetical protein